METLKKHHYRKVFKSNHLGVADIEDFIEEKRKLVFTIKEVKQEIDVVVAGKKGSHNIAYFKEDIKPLVLNAGNSSIIKSFNNGSPFVEDWSNTIVELYIQENVRFGKDITSGVRVRTVQPKKEKLELTPATKDLWDAAKKYLNGKGTIEGIKSKYILSSDNEKLLKNAKL